ncbi:hypothetical protein [Rhodanobacter soli]
MQHGAYGDRLAASFRLSEPPTLTSHTAGGARMAATELARDEPGYGFTAPIAAEPAYLVGLQLRAVQRHELWLDGRAVAVKPITPGTTHFYDLERNPVAYLPEPFHPLFFYMPRAALAEQAEELGDPGIDDLRHTPGEFLADSVVHQFGLCLLPALHARNEVHQLFVNHVLLADFRAGSCRHRRRSRCRR